MPDGLHPRPSGTGRLKPCQLPPPMSPAMRVSGSKRGRIPQFVVRRNPSVTTCRHLLLRGTPVAQTVVVACLQTE